MKKIVLAGMLFLSLCALSVCGFRICSEWEDLASVNEQQALKPALYFPDRPKEPNAGPAGMVSGENTEPQPGLPLMGFSGLNAQNSDIVAWLTIDGTGIDYPVAQAEDNRYYLTHTAVKKTAKQGAIFMEFRNNRDFSDFSSILYGHNLQSGNMFGQLVKFKEKQFFESHTAGMLYTPDKTYRLEIIGCAVTDPGGQYYQYAFSSPAERAAYVQALKSGAAYWRGAGINTETDKLLVLSTCSYEFKDARTVVVAKMLEGM